MLLLFFAPNSRMNLHVWNTIFVFWNFGHVFAIWRNDTCHIVIFILDFRVRRHEPFINNETFVLGKNLNCNKKFANYKIEIWFPSKIFRKQVSFASTHKVILWTVDYGKWVEPRNPMTWKIYYLQIGKIPTFSNSCVFC